MEHCQLVLIGFLQFFQNLKSAVNNISKIKQHAQVTRWPFFDKSMCISKEIMHQLQGQTVRSPAQRFVQASPC